MTTAEQTIYIKRYDPSDPRLGRHVRHDSRSKNFAVEAKPLNELKSVRHTRRIPILDQGQIGSCTGNAATGCIGTDPFFTAPLVRAVLSETDATLDEQYALQVYSKATLIDTTAGSYPPDDTGSDGLSVAKVLKGSGLIEGYRHAFSLEASLTALSERPVIIGTEWLGDMFKPLPDGRLVPVGSVEGGHEYVLDELDVENKRVWMDNSWTPDWGIQGRAYLTWDDLGKLLDAQGDCTVFTPLSS